MPGVEVRTVVAKLGPERQRHQKLQQRRKKLEEVEEDEDDWTSGTIAERSRYNLYAGSTATTPAAHK
jgi:hypothetical protein